MKLNIKWLMVIAIALVQGAISVAWIVYRVYLPTLFDRWGLIEGLAATIMIIEGFLGIIIEPLFGSLSDRQQSWLGTRFPLISLGVILASAFLIAIPTLVIFGQPQMMLKWLLPAIAIAWALAMAMFRSPVISLFAMSAPLQQIPLAVSISTAIIGFIGAFRPIISKFILSLGEMFAFSLASLLILGSVALLRQFKPILPSQALQFKSESVFKPLSWSKLGLIVTMALGMAWGTRLLTIALTKGVNNPNTMIIVGVIVAIAALPMGFFTLKIGNYQAMLSGTIGAILITLLLNLKINAISLGLGLMILPFALNCLLNGTIPLIIKIMPSRQISLGIGVYFGGFTAAMSLFDLLLKPELITPKINLVFGLIAWILVAISVNFSNRKITDKLRAS
jgi:MFS family permease